MDGADLILRLPGAALIRLLAGSTDGMAVEGGAGVLARLVAMLDALDPDDEIVLP